MKVRAQLAMVINLDKCLGCNACSVTCKNTWTNRPGAEYMWFNNVETKPGIGYPKEWENQDKWKGGWELKGGKLRLRIGGKLSRLLNIFHNPVLPTIDDYYEPWTYDYEKLIESEEVKDQPVARPISLISKEYMDKINWGPNWGDDLAGVNETAHLDPDFKGIEELIKLEYENTFMFYLPRLCNHCLNPSCVAACPAGAIYKRVEDGIVLVDQEACRGWRFCISACPYKKIYFNWKTHKAEKCTFCYPRIEAGLPTICSETCVGRIRYIGVILYDADRVKEAASVPDEKKLVESQLSIFLDPFDEKVKEKAIEDGIPEDWIDAARKSPAYKLIMKWRIAFPLHPEYRTLPMIWYVPPLSPISDRLAGKEVSLLEAIDNLRIPIKYLANLFTAGNEEAVREVLRKLAVLREYMNSKTLGKPFDKSLLAKVNLTEDDLKEMHRLLAIAKYEERFVIPTNHKEITKDPYFEQGIDGLPFYERELYGKRFRITKKDEKRVKR
mgnify:CR=1 FL=1